MNVTELYKYFDGAIPCELSEDWDNDGRMLVSSDKEIRNVLVALDVTPEVAEVAVKGGYDLIVTHHPLIFKPLRGIVDPMLVSLIQAEVSVFSFHTRLDTVDGGVNDCLAAALGLKNAEPFCEMGRVGDIDEIKFDEFVTKVKKTLGCERVNFVMGKDTVRRVALLGGGGKDFWADAAVVADVYITGEMSYNTMLDAHKAGFSVIEAGHFHTEFPVCERICDMLLDADSSLNVDIMKFYPVNTL
ncbi:MAG: Nif3-like dinuclear metal center hexameric protein [Clostridia bacterium]|nr:Nif3-like dinuclear metal center hexameric protein [Clostridia bacterium]